MAMPGGQVAIRGYLVQTLIALLDALDDDRPWDSVTLEPNVKSDKVDILWRYQDSTTAVQVKSSQNPFRRADVGEWAEELKTWRDAHRYELVLIGTPESPSVAQIRIAWGVEVRYWNAGGFREFQEPRDWKEQVSFKTRPVVGVSWWEAMAFCRWAGVRLLTEAQWERAARGTTGRKYPWGNEPPDKDRANFNRNAGHPTAVGVYPLGTTPDGIHDLAGKLCVDKFTHDCYRLVWQNSCVFMTSL